MLERNNRSDEALSAYRRAVEIEPQYYRNQQALGTFYFDRAKYSDAADHFTKTTELAPGEPNAHYALGVTYLNLGRFTDAENELRFAIHLSETPASLYALGHVLMYEGKDQEAIPYIAGALQLGPEIYLGWMNLGIAYRRTNRQAESDRASRQALELAEKELTQDPRNGADPLPPGLSLCETGRPGASGIRNRASFAVFARRCRHALGGGHHL